MKISELRSLNDAFELLPFDLSDPDLRHAIIASRNQIGQGRGILCFSRYWHNPVLWAHYADCHRGLCLGFDLPEGDRDIAQAVEYVEHPLKLDRLDLETANKMLFTKYSHWQYEDEIRVWANLEGRSGDYYFKEFDDDLKLKEVIVGAGNLVSLHRLHEALGSHRDHVRLAKARLAYDAFRVVEDEHGFAKGPHPGLHARASGESG